MVAYLTLWLILVGLAAPLWLYAAFVRPSGNDLHIPPIWRAVPLMLMTTVSAVLALSPARWHQLITQLGFMSLQVSTLFLNRFVPIKPREMSILGLNKKD